jgi:urea transport system substrate-binding protein
MTNMPGATGSYQVFQGLRFRLEKVMKSRIELVLAGLIAAVGCKGPGEAAPAAAGSASPAAASAPAAAPAAAKVSDTGPIKVGILHSLSGTMAISETSLKDVALMTIEQINAAGGVKGRKLEPVVVDPASNWPLFAEKARELLQKEGVAVTFGCWTSVSRKSVLPVFEELNGLLFYPVQYEGEESSYNVFYTGAAPNQQAIPAVEY